MAVVVLHMARYMPKCMDRETVAVLFIAGRLNLSCEADVSIVDYTTCKYICMQSFCY